jgi:glycosyltransferase involved in cell wall biosynthesis
MRTVSVLIPSRTCAQQRRFLLRALASVDEQRLGSDWALDAIIALDPGTVEPITGHLFSGSVKRGYVWASRASQAAALNAAALASKSDYLAILEDDDAWLPFHLKTALGVLTGEKCDFVSSTQIEREQESGRVIRINDFPTPSGWAMARKTFERIGRFDESYRWHVDNDYLGRIADAKLARVHLVEATAPDRPDDATQVRPWLAQIHRGSEGRLRLCRHSSPYPSVERFVHSGSGMAKIASHPETAGSESHAEYLRLITRYRRVPW